MEDQDTLATEAGTTETSSSGSSIASPNLMVTILTQLEMLFWGCLTALSLPGFGLTPVLWLGFAAYFIPLWRAIQAKEAGWSLMLKGALFFAGYVGFGQSWLLSLHPMGWLGFSPLESVLFSGFVFLLNVALWASFGALFLAASYVVGCWLPHPLWLLPILPALWMLFLSLWSQLPIVVPWLTPELSLMQSDAFRPLVAMGGGLFWGGLVLAVSALIAWYVIALLRRAWPAWCLALGALLCVALTLYTQFGKPVYVRQPILSDNTQAALQSVGVLQGNCSIKAIRGNKPEERLACQKTYIKLAEDALLKAKIHNRPLNWLVLPEEGALAAPVLTQNDKSLPKAAFEPWLTLSQTHHVGLILGGSLWQTEKKQLSNALFWLAPSSKPKTTQANVSLLYEKTQLVPFGEALPEWSKSLMRLRLPSYNPATYTAGKHFAPKVILNLPNTPPETSLQIAPLICFELTSQAKSKAYQRQGAQVLVNSSNLGWFHNNPKMQAQFEAMAKLRAVETGLSVIVAANTGRSVIVEGGTGKVITSLGDGEIGSLRWR
jgi:apolipoprotein N-acyltransferase